MLCHVVSSVHVRESPAPHKDVETERSTCLTMSPHATTARLDGPRPCAQNLTALLPLSG